MPERLGPHVEGLILAEHLKQLFIESVCFKEVLFKGLFEVGVVLDEDGLAAEFLTHGLQLFYLLTH